LTLEETDFQALEFKCLTSPQKFTLLFCITFIKYQPPQLDPF